jgi:alditol oxidase
MQYNTVSAPCHVDYPQRLNRSTAMLEKQTNWAGNLTYRAARLHRPETLEQVRELVRAGHKLRVLGSRHSFNDIADSPEDLISLEYFNKVVAIDGERGTVTVEGGVKYGDLCRELHAGGYALHNMASLPHISIAGACATATHGSGDQNGNLATAVAALELITADGELVTLSREHDGEQFAGAVVNLGGLGVVSKVTLDLQPAFEVRQHVYENLPLADLDQHFEEVMARGYSVSLLTDWQRERVNQVWVKQRVSGGEAAEAGLFGATAATQPRHPIDGISAASCTEQLGIPGPWHERLPHFRMNFTPSNGEELQSEYFVPRAHALAAIRSLDRLREPMAALLQISEVRTIAADTLWMSPCYGQACVALHFTWVKDWPAVRELLPLLEELLAPFDARPHWGKLFTTPPERLAALYERLPDFQELLRSYDPQGKFRNAFLDRNIFGAVS